MTERELRTFVKEVVASASSNQPPRIVEEFFVGESGRIDLALIGKTLVGYELKSDLDTLNRLPRQMQAYGEVFEYCTLVVTERHLQRARQELRPGWGLAVVSQTLDGTYGYQQIRKARFLKTGSKEAVAGLLWRDEALTLLEQLGQSKGIRSKPRQILQSRLSEVCDLPQLRSLVAETLTARQGWQDGQERRASVERFLPEGGSSRFLARRLR
ncbi:sce7726 family protein [Clavibacter michiganensis subsp. michiganensis]|uniref:sce7726 family protein n=1 Tax=Clavibacter michiganensis TaxID=28447 RepID=UPI00345BCF2B